jgi:hypothetical protein
MRPYCPNHFGTHQRIILLGQGLGALRGELGPLVGGPRTAQFSLLAQLFHPLRGSLDSRSVLLGERPPGRQKLERVGNIVLGAPQEQQR